MKASHRDKSHIPVREQTLTNFEVLDPIKRILIYPSFSALFSSPRPTTPRPGSLVLSKAADGHVSCKQKPHLTTLQAIAMLKVVNWHQQLAILMECPSSEVCLQDVLCRNGVPHEIIHQGAGAHLLALRVQYCFHSIRLFDQTQLHKTFSLSAPHAGKRYHVSVVPSSFFLKMQACMVCAMTTSTSLPKYKTVPTTCLTVISEWHSARFDKSGNHGRSELPAGES